MSSDRSSGTHTPGPKSIGDVVRMHAQQAQGGTDDGIRMLELERVEDRGTRNGAANLYLSALSLLKKSNSERDALLASVKELETLLHKIIAAALAELKAVQSAQVARDNYTDPRPDLIAYTETRLALHDAIADADRLFAKQP